MSVIFPLATLGPEMAAPILWAPGIYWLFLLGNPHLKKIVVLGGFWVFWKGGGVEVPILFLWARGFFDPPRSQSGNDREMTTSPPSHR